MYAGVGWASWFGDGGFATMAALNSPYDVYCHPNGNLYIAGEARGRALRAGGATGCLTARAVVSRSPDTGNHAIRVVVPAYMTAAGLSSQTIATWAGTPTVAGSSGDGERMGGPAPPVCGRNAAPPCTRLLQVARPSLRASARPMQSALTRRVRSDSSSTLEMRVRRPCEHPARAPVPAPVAPSRARSDPPRRYRERRHHAHRWGIRHARLCRRRSWHVWLPRLLGVQRPRRRGGRDGLRGGEMRADFPCAPSLAPRAAGYVCRTTQTTASVPSRGRR